MSSRTSTARSLYVDTLGLRLGHRSPTYAQLDAGRTRLALFERAALAATLGTGCTNNAAAVTHAAAAAPEPPSARGVLPLRNGRPYA